MKIKYLSENMQLDLSKEELILIIGSLEDKLKKQRDFLQFYSDESNIEFFEEKGINISEKTEGYKAKMDKLQHMLKDIC